MTSATCSFCGGARRAVYARDPDLSICVECVEKAWEILAYPRAEWSADIRQPLTKRQRQQLNFLIAFEAEHGYAPSFEEIAAHFGYHTLSTVHEALQRLEIKGWIVRNFNEVRSITIVQPAAA